MKTKIITIALLLTLLTGCTVQNSAQKVDVKEKEPIGSKNTPVVWDNSNVSKDSK